MSKSQPKPLLVLGCEPPTPLSLSLPPGLLLGASALSQAQTEWKGVFHPSGPSSDVTSVSVAREGVGIHQKPD